MLANKKSINKDISKERNRNILRKKNKNKTKGKILADKKEEENIQIPTMLDHYHQKNILNKSNNPPKKKRKNMNINISNKKNTFINPINSINLNSKNLMRKNDEIIKKAKKIMEYNDRELNELPFDLAIKYDKRTFSEYYISLLKTKHIFIFSFVYSNDYNSRIIKIDLFFISFIIYFTVNALFFNDNTMHKIYEDQGTFNFVYQLPQIAYSSLISSVINILLNLLGLSEGNIIDYKKDKSKVNLDKRESDLKNKLCFKLVIYYILSSVLLLFFCYYLAMFCAIFRNTQLHLIKDTLICFGLSLLYPFGIYLLPGIFRIPALSNPKNKRICLYHLSRLFQMF